jgi:acetyl esterase/lipase
VPTQPETFVYKTAGCDVHADVYLPEKRKAALRAIVYIHGGALIMGSRKHFPRGQMQRYLDAGFAVVSIDYRLAPETKLAPIIEDVRDAFAWVRSEGRSRFGIDPARVAAIGCSAGGYLTLMTGFAVKPRPKALVSFYGYGDIIGDWYTKPDPFYCGKPRVSREAALFSVGRAPISETTEDRDPFYLYCRQNGLWPKEVAGLDPVTARDAFKPFCPLENISREYPPTLLLHGDKDTDVPYQQSVLMANALSRAGVDSALVTVEGGGHGFDADEDSPDTKSALDEMLAFLREHV